MKLNKPIVGMATTGGGDGYWLVASDGGVFSYGDAQFWGSAGSMHLNAPIVGIVGSYLGYWLVPPTVESSPTADAAFHGSSGDMRLNAPIVAMALTHRCRSGTGYVGLRRRRFHAYGAHARYYRVPGALHLAQPVIGMAAMPPTARWPSSR